VPTLIPVDEAGKPNEDRVSDISFFHDERRRRDILRRRRNTSSVGPHIQLSFAQSVYESLIAVDYVDAIANPPDESRRLVPSDPYLAAKCRYWADRLNRECCSPYYGVLVRTEEGERRENYDRLVNGLRAFSREMEKNGDGMGFLGGRRLSSVDVSLMPWAYRCVTSVPVE
jgi:glutathione S-transferase